MWWNLLFNQKIFHVLTFFLFSSDSCCLNKLFSYFSPPSFVASFSVVFGGDGEESLGKQEMQLCRSIQLNVPSSNCCLRNCATEVLCSFRLLFLGSSRILLKHVTHAVYLFIIHKLKITVGQTDERKDRQADKWLYFLFCSFSFACSLMSCLSWLLFKLHPLLLPAFSHPYVAAS